MQPKRSALLDELSSASDEEDYVRPLNVAPVPLAAAMSPPPNMQNTHLWNRMKALLPEKTASSRVLGIDYGSEKHQLLHEEIEEIVRTRGRMNHSELVPLPPPDDDDDDSRAGMSPRPPAPTNRKAVGPSSPISPSSKQGRPSKIRYLAVKTTSYAPYVPSVYAKAGRTAEDTINIVSTRFTFITLFFVGVACGKFKRLLRRRTLWEQQERYEEMLKKSIAERHALINKPEAKHFSVARAKELVQRTRIDVATKFSEAVRHSNQRARMVRLNPRTALGRHASSGTLKDGVSMPTASPVNTCRIGELGDFLVQYNPPRASLTDDIQNATLLTLVPDGTASPYHHMAVSRGAEVSPRSHMPPAAYGPNGSFATLEASPRHGSFTRDEAPSLHSSTRVVPAFEQYSDQNVFVVNTLWDDMEYRPLRDRSKKTLIYQEQALPSTLSAFTQSVLPASSRRVQESYSDVKKKGKRAEGTSVEGTNNAEAGGVGGASEGLLSAPQHQLGAVSAAAFGNQSSVASPTTSVAMSPHFIALQAANLDIDAKMLVPYEVGHRSVARSVNVVGLRAARSVAKPSAAPFDFYSWRVRQNRALFHHLCQEHRELIQESVATGQSSVAIEPMPLPTGDIVVSPCGGTPQHTPPRGGDEAGGSTQRQSPLSAKDLQALRERVRRRAEDIEFNADDSASRTYDAFVVHKELEHAAFLRNSQAEVERLLTTKEALSGDTKHSKLLELIDRPDAGGNLVERFKRGIGNLERGIRKDLEKSTIEENERYNRGWILTMAHRVAAAFDGRLPPEGDAVVRLALETAQRSSYRDLTMHDLEEGVVQGLDIEELVSAPAQFMLERLLPAFSSSPADAIQSPVDAKARLRAMFSKRRCPYILLSVDDEREHKELYGLSDDDKVRYANAKALKSVERLNAVMEPHFEKLALAALNTVEARHAAMRLEHRRLRDQLAKSEDDALVKAATLDRRRGSKASGSVVGDDGRRRSTVVMSLGLESLSPSTGKARRESLFGAEPPTDPLAATARQRLLTVNPGHHASPRGQRRPSHTSIMAPHPPSALHNTNHLSAVPPPVATAFRRNSFGGAEVDAGDGSAQQ